MQAGKGYSLTLTHPRQIPRIGALLSEARVAVTPLGPSLRLAGTLEIAGNDERINPARVRGIIRALPEYYPDFRAEDFADVKPWCGLRPVHPTACPTSAASLPTTISCSPPATP